MAEGSIRANVSQSKYRNVTYDGYTVHADQTVTVSAEEIALLRQNVLTKPAYLKAKRETQREAGSLQETLTAFSTALSGPVPTDLSQLQQKLEGLESFQERANSLNIVQKAEAQEELLRRVERGEIKAYPVYHEKGWGSFFISLFTIGGVTLIFVWGLGALSQSSPFTAFKESLLEGNMRDIALAGVFLIMPLFIAVVMGYHAVRAAVMASYIALRTLFYDAPRWAYAACQGKKVDAKELAYSKTLLREVAVSIQAVVLAPLFGAAYIIAHLLTILDLPSRFMHGDSLRGRKLVAKVERAWNRNIPLQKGFFGAAVLGEVICCNSNIGREHNFVWNRGNTAFYWAACYQPQGIYVEDQGQVLVFIWNGSAYQVTSTKLWKS